MHLLVTDIKAQLSTIIYPGGFLGNTNSKIAIEVLINFAILLSKDGLATLVTKEFCLYLINLKKNKWARSHKSREKIQFIHLK